MHHFTLSVLYMKMDGQFDKLAILSSYYRQQCSTGCSEIFPVLGQSPDEHTHTHTTVFWLSGFCLGQYGWAGTRRNIHPLTPTVVISHPLSAYSIYYDPWHPLCSIYMPDSLFPQSLSKFSLVYLLAWHPKLHTPYISSTNHCLLFAVHAHTIATRFAVVPRLCHLILVSLSTLYLELYLVA